MASLTDLPTDQFMLILNRLSWLDLSNFCSTNRTMCQHPRIQQFLNNRFNEITDDIVNLLRSIPDDDDEYGRRFHQHIHIYKTVEFRSYDSRHRFIFNGVIDYVQDYDGKMQPTLIYFFTEVLTGTLIPRMVLPRFKMLDYERGEAVDQSVDQSVDQMKFKYTIEFEIEEKLEEIIQYLLINGYIDDAYTEITYEQFMDIISGARGGSGILERIYDEY